MAWWLLEYKTRCQLAFVSTKKGTRHCIMDLSSNSNPEEVVVKHLDWTLSVNFEENVIQAEATYTIDFVQPHAGKICLDTSGLRIQSVRTFDGLPLDYILYPKNAKKPHLGQLLEVKLQFDAKESSDERVTIAYATTKESSALQWLSPSQTAGKLRPFLFTQCQAIHARALLPCQDRCGVKMTYSARVTVPNWATCVMSAVLADTKENLEGAKVYTWNQPIPISSYLIAIAVGEIAKKDISARCAVWSEPSLLDAAEYEFAETEQFLKTAEDISGKKYVWGRYDLLCLPPSFPFGGMENPCMTFVTPTLLAGDRSLADVVAHEISHSWTGECRTAGGGVVYISLLVFLS